MKLGTKLLPYFFYFLSISPFMVFFLKYPEIPKRDWDYFNSLAMIIRSSVLKGELPLIDLWICGGLDILSNPQNWIFSPLILLTIIFPSFIGNALSLLICAIAGFTGMSRLLKDSTAFEKVTFPCLFVLSPFFFLHFSEGHIPYRTFYLLPWILFLSQELNLKRFFFLTSVLTLMILDGGIYPFYFSIILLLFNMKWSSLKRLLIQRPKDLFFIIFGHTLLLLAKALPVLFIYRNLTAEDERISFSLQNVISSLFSIKQSNFRIMENQYYFFHEYGHYIGFSLTVLFLISWKSLIKHRVLSLQLILFLWMAFGWGGDINPWSLIKSIPFIKQMHVQSRTLLLAYIIFLLILAKSELKAKWKNGLLIMAILELCYCGFYVTTHAYQEKRNISSFTIIDKAGPAQKYEIYIPKPEIYSSGLFSLACYEPAKPHRNQGLLELFIPSRPDLKVMKTGEKLIITSENSISGKFILNYNWNAGWDCDHCEPIENENLIQINPKGNMTKLELNYAPFYLQFVLASFIMGLFIITYCITKVKKDEF